jgi:hypothetical protein
MRNHVSALLWLAAIGLALGVMIPRLASSQLGLLDDGLMLRTGGKVIGSWSTVLHLIPDTGRFVPVYWLTHGAVFGFVGARPFVLFAVNVFMFTVVLAILGRLVLFGGGGKPHVVVALILLALSGPAVETFYTLSKPEPLQLMWIGISLLATGATFLQKRLIARAALAALSVAALLLGHATKETSVVMVPVSLGWLAFTAISEQRTYARFAVRYVLINVTAVLAFAALRWTYAPLPLSQGWYTRAYSVDVATMGASLFRISVWVARDFAFLLPLLVLGGWSFIEGRAAPRRLMLYAGIWMAGWLGVYVPWPATFEYYLFPFAFGAAALGGGVIGDTWVRLSGELSPVRRCVAWSGIALTTLLWGLTVANAIADARVQLSVDRANAQLVDFLGSVPAQSRIVVNIAHVNEYVYELPMHLADIKQRPDVSVTYGANAVSDPTPGAPLFVVTPEIEYQPIPTVRIAPHQPPAVNADTIRDRFNGRADVVYRSHQQTRVLELGVHRVLCRLSAPPIFDATYCPSDRGVLYWQTFSYGWQVHRLGSARESDR